MLKRTPLYPQHAHANAQFVDFNGWEMPLHYGSQLVEHRYVRTSVGLFDVSHMGVVDVLGEDAFYFLQRVLANDVSKLTRSGAAFYTCMLNLRGGILDDMIVYRLGEQGYRLVINAGTTDKILQWLSCQAERYTVVIEQRPELAILALQGPDAIRVLKQFFNTVNFNQQIAQTAAFNFILYKDFFIARTGYTGEEGVEIISTVDQARHLWKRLLKNGVQPCGLGARDTLRLEAGFNLSHVDMSEDTTPFESNLAWTVSWRDRERDFLGKQALLTQLEQGVTKRLVGIKMTEPGVLRNHQKIYFSDNLEGEITSGGFSPTLGFSIALARIPAQAVKNPEVERRGKKIPVELVKPPFIRRRK